MLSPCYTHVLLIISCIIFFFSAISFIKRIQIHSNLTQPTQILSVYDNHHSQNQFSSYTTIINKNHLNTSDEQINERFLNKKVLALNKTYNSILDRLTFINPPKSICIYPKHTQNFIVFIVLSRALNFDFRQAIRATWGRNGKYKQYNIHVQTIFFVGTDDSVQSAIRLEQSLFNDVVEVVIPENYPFVAHKELASLFWTRLYCPLARLIFRADDDILLDTFLLLDYIKNHLNINTQDGLHGWFRFNNTVHRADKWAITKIEYKPKIYPPYTFGIGYLFSNVSCQRLVNAANRPKHQVIRVGDAYITGILRDLARIPYYDFQNLEYAYTFYNPISCDIFFEDKPQLLLCMSKLHVGIRDDPFEFYDVWNIILTKHHTSLSNAT
ncbi:unnamed protein product [Rotaria sordida]|uniref:Hexosyltransferase n=1 Tax=Rotaria sordida TaxID=392033 RepID=A0A813R3N2_9BILA|nr:unnamed protein product [Rotaria sordida]CAF1175047.1 unnamed protein product [Rotaria sordida]CAF3770508.1 unnamed protein product [Rotaria sordida]